jgi:hypothetical protein
MPPPRLAPLVTNITAPVTPVTLCRARVVGEILSIRDYIVAVLTGPTDALPSSARVVGARTSLCGPNMYSPLQATGSGSGLFYIRGRPSTAIGCGTWIIAFCHGDVIAVPMETSLTWSSPRSHSSSGQHPHVCAQAIGGISGWGTPTTAAVQLSSHAPYVTASVRTQTRTRDMHSTIWERKKGRPMFKDVGKTSTTCFGRPSDNQTTAGKRRVSSPVGLPVNAQ